MTNLEVYKKAIKIFEDLQNNDCGWLGNSPAVIATIIYQLIDEKENKNESI